MLNRKQKCEYNRAFTANPDNCKGTSTFFLMSTYNNRFAPKYTNSRTDIINGKIENLNTNRINGELCSPSNPSTKQQRLTMRNKPTPYRVPYNHYRKSYNCNDLNNCILNEKIIKTIDNSNCEIVDGILQPLCTKKNYVTNRFTNKFGMRNTNNGGDYRNYLEHSGKLYEQNAFGILPENKDLSGVNLYKINTVNGTPTANGICKLSYRSATSITTNINQYAKINTATRKYANPGYNSRTSVNSRNRVQRLKYNTILSGQMTNYKNGYNNCINGEECSKYISPGPNTKLFSLSGTYKRGRPKCYPPRINGMRQACPPGV